MAIFYQIHLFGILLAPGLRTEAHSSSVISPGEWYDDWHYPNEENSQRIPPPLVRIIESNSVYLVSGEQISVGEATADGWLLIHSLNRLTSQWAVWERTLARWGSVAFVAPASVKDAPVVLRKPVGELSALRQPRFATNSTYLDAAESSLEDYPMAIARNASSRNKSLAGDDEPRFSYLAATLAPQRDTVAISNAADVVKFAVSYSGRIKCASRPPEDAIGGDYRASQFEGTCAKSANHRVRPA